MKKGYVSGRVDAGVELVDINNFASAFYYRVANLGVYVNNVTRSDIALQKGDYIVSLDGQRINDSKQFKSLIEKKAVGDSVSLEIYRNGQKQTVSLTLTELKTGK